ncbi:MAG: ATP-dependent zinc metalloprotease FtsH [Desulfoprunum sp.]|uniref:ATP-dependent zinc metalloprotease FtsH n=1 Tax=Desulfoprunum sp. TaxID=2020866 RepID=UPI00052D8E8F|nr:cell division protein FtsH [Desulfobulbus sp. Tol-SR]
MENNTKFNVWYVLAAVWGVLLLQSLIFDQFRAKVIPYSEFIQALTQDKVIEIAIGQDRISGKMKNETGDGEVVFTTVRVDSDLTQKLAEHNVKFSGQVENTFFKTLLSWFVPILLFFGIWYLLMRKLQGGQAGIMNFGKNKAKIVGEKDIDTRFGDVAGADEAKEELQEIVDYLARPERYLEVGGQMPKGVLLVGPPGTGKTLIARAVAGEAGVPFFSMSGSEFVELFVGMGAARVRDLFDQARDKAPCIIFIDELDALGKARGAGGYGGHDEREQTLNQLLVEMDGFDTQKGIVIMAATNRPEVLDPALLRSGRFDRQVLIDRPDVNGREEILKIHVRKVKLEDEVDIRVIAQKTAGFTGADLANAVNEAALLAVRKGRKKVSTVDLDEAVDRIVGGLEKKNRVINPQEKKIVAYHEVGHALVATLTPGSEPVHKISIIPRGLAALGYTQQRPTEDRYLMSADELLAKIDVLLGGRVAEQIFFDSVTTGAGNDLTRATDIARAMIVEYGMGKTLGLSTYPRQRGPVFLPTEHGYAGGRDFSDDTATRIDAETREILDQRHQHVMEMLTERRDKLAAIAELLLEKEVLLEEEFIGMVKED